MTKLLSTLILVAVQIVAIIAIAADTVVIIPLPTCSDGLTKCSGLCVDTMNNPNFCGDCTTICGSGRYCNNGICAKDLGEVCSSGNECASGNCVDNFCCHTACSSLCESCQGATTGGVDGICGYITASTDPENECTNSLLCNGIGICAKSLGEACSTGSECASGNCVDGFCCDTKCSSLCESCQGASNGGLDGTCGYITTSTDPENECDGVGPSFCNGNGRCLDTCNDGILNNDETFVDCGGVICGMGANGCDCSVNSDCVSGLCDVATQTCISP